MNLAHKLRKAFAIVATVALLATNASIAIAQTFNDVATDAWYFDYVEQLVDQGVFDVSDNFRPGDVLNRAELVKIVITAVDGLAGYEAPSTPTFTDVPADAWFYDYVEAAVQLDIVQGYTDAAGNLTGKFGPSDTVNRAAATKILVNAFSVPTTVTPAGSFADVPASAWFYDYVTTAYNQSIVDGYANGNFGPADPITRAQVAKLVVNSQSPVARAAAPATPTTPTTPTTPGTPAPVVSNGDLEVSLNDNTARSTTVPLGASSVSLLSFDLTAADDDVTCDSFTLARGGVGTVTDWAELFLYEGVNRLTTGRTINNDTNLVTFPISMTVEAGTTKTLRLVGRVDTAANGATANNQHYFYLASAGDLSCNSQSVAGDFPVAGNTFTIGNVAVNSLTLSAGTTPAQPLIGAQNAEIASFRTVAGADHDIAIQNITVTQNGTLSASRLTNLKLLRGNDVVATADSFSNRERITFVLTTPYVLKEGQTQNWYVRADINGGRTTDTIELYMDETSDVVATDQQYGSGAAITNNYTTDNVTALNLKGGKITITDNGPAARQIAQNVTNNELLKYSITTDRDLTVRDAVVQVTITDGTNTPDVEATLTTGDVTSVAASGTNYDITTDAHESGYAAGDMLQITEGTTAYYARVVSNDGSTDGGGLVVASGSDLTVLTAAATIVEVNPYSYIKNLRVVDVDTGGTLQGPLTLVSQGTKSGTTNTVYRKKFTEDYELAEGTTRHLGVQVDTDQYMVAGYQIVAVISYSMDPDDGSADQEGYLKDFAANQDIVLSDLVGDGLTGKPMTIAANSLTVGLSASPNPTNTAFIKGQTGVNAAGFTFTAGDAGDVKVKKLTVRFAGEADTAFAAAGGTIEAKTIISSASLYIGDELIGAAEGLTINSGTTYTAGTSYDVVEFDDLNIVVPAGETKTVTVRLNLQSSIGTLDASTPNYVAAYLGAAADVTAEDKDANVITASGTPVNGVASATHARLVTVKNSGTLTVAESGSPTAMLVVAGATKQLVAQYDFASANEAWQVQEVSVMNDAAGALSGTAVSTSAVRNVWIEYPDVNGVMQLKSQSLISGEANFSGLDPAMYVPKGGNAALKVYADVQTAAGFGQTLSGQSFRLGLREDNTDSASGTFRAVGAASGESEYNPTISDTSRVYAHFVRFSAPTVTGGATGGVFNNGTFNLFVLKVTAPVGTDAENNKGIEIKRLNYRVSVSTDGTDGNLSKFRVREGATAGGGSDMTSDQATLTARALTGDATLGAANNVYTDTNDFLTAIGSTEAAGGQGYVTVNFATPVKVNAGSTKYITLVANGSGADNTSDSVSTYIPDDTYQAGTGSVGTPYFPGCWYLLDQATGTANDTIVITDFDCDGALDAGEYGLNVLGDGTGATTTQTYTAEASDFAVDNGVLSGALTVQDPDDGALDDHVVYFDTDADGVIDDNEIVIDASETAAATNFTDVCAEAAGVETTVVISGAENYCRISENGLGLGLLVYDTDAAAATLSLVIGNQDGARAATDLHLEVIAVGTGTLNTSAYAVANDTQVASGDIVNFLWSDKSSETPSHGEFSSDWTSGYLVDTLGTSSQVWSR